MNNDAIDRPAPVGRPPSSSPNKVATTIRLDADILAFFKASGKGWQTRINNALRDYVRNHTPDSTAK